MSAIIMILFQRIRINSEGKNNNKIGGKNEMECIENDDLLWKSRKF